MNASHPINIEALLTHIPLFEGLGSEEISRIARSTREVPINKGDILFHKGDPNCGFYLLVYGQIKLAFTSQQGNEKVVEILQQGKSFGEAVMFMEKPYIVFAQALTDSLLLTGPDGASLRFVLTSNPTRFIPARNASSVTCCANLLKRSRTVSMPPSPCQPTRASSPPVSI